MRIQHNIMAMNSYRNYTNNANSLSKNLEKLSSGYKINRAGDDAAGLAISEKMRASIAVYDKAQDNANDGISLVKTAEGALQEVHDMLNRMETLATQAANGTYEESDREAIGAEISQLCTEINRIGATTKFNGVALFDGNLDTSICVGENGTDDMIAITVSQIISDEQLGINGVKDAVEAGGDTAQGAIATIKDAIGLVSTLRGELGAIQNRLEHTVKNLSVMTENLQNAESTIRDTDIADEMTAYTKNNILIQSAQAMLAQANQVPQGVLQLLQ